MDDLLDQLERMLRGQAEPDQRDVGMFPCRYLADCFDVGLAGDHFVPEARDDLCEQVKAVAPLVRDQDTEVLYLFLNQGSSSVRSPG
jgi:hypothetical protein